MVELFPDVDRSDFIWDADRCANNPWYVTQYSSSPDAAARRELINYLVSRVTDRRFKRKICDLRTQQMNGPTDRASYYSIVSELIVHELLLVNGYNIEYEIGEGKKIDFLAKGNNHSFNIEVIHKESIKIDIDQLKEGGYFISTGSTKTHVSAITRCLKDKHSKYYELNDLPYIIAIDNQQDGCTLMGFFNTLYGELKPIVSIGEDSKFLGYEIEPDGWFTSLRDPNLYGVLALSGAHINNLSLTECCMFPNPYFGYKLVGLFPNIQDCYPDGEGRITIQSDDHGMPAIQGTLLSELINIPE